ncbi:MAG: hypothetical protein B6I38_10745 [Anaerolineaceae bacterium 4572_5.1]|nr:MAG: hypothetical protein B6I38_10745 [Anaerolineaceae bacterium 4572_5.1]
MTNKHSREHHPCPQCHVGLMHLEHQTYFTWIKREMVTIPDFPVWVCLMCGAFEYDIRVVDWISKVLELHEKKVTPDTKLNFGHQTYSPDPISFFTIN